MVELLPLIDTKNQAVWRLWAELMPLLAVIIVTIIFWMIEKKQVELKLFKNPGVGIKVGVIGGISWLGSVLIIMSVIGVIRFEGRNDLSMLSIWLLASTLNVIMQELLVRGYLYQMIKQKHNIVAATIATTMLFTAFHGGAFEAGIIAVLNVITMSILMSIVLEYTESIIALIMMHGIWNGLGGIVFGVLSLAGDYPHLLKMAFSGNNILSGGPYKIEGSIVVLFINIFMICLFLFFQKRKTRFQNLATVD